MFSSKDLERAFRDIGALTFPRGKVLELGVYGRAALVLGSNFRLTTDVVEVIAYSEPGSLGAAAAQVAREHGWAPDWISGRVGKYVSRRWKGPVRHHAFFGTYPCEEWPGLRLYLPSAEYLLAMEVMATAIEGGSGRLSAGELRQLIGLAGVQDADELAGYVWAFYPEVRGSARVMQEAARIWSAPSAPVGELPEAAHYAGGICRTVAVPPCDGD